MAVVLLLLAVASVGVGGSGIERVGSIVQVASGPAATPGGGSVSRAGDEPARLDADVIGRAPTEDGGGGSGGDRGGEGGSGSDGGGAEAAGPGAAQSGGSPAPVGSGTDGGPESGSPAAGADSPTGGAPSGGGTGDPLGDTVDGVTDQVPDLPKPPDDVVGGILDDRQLPGGIDKPNRLLP